MTNLSDITLLIAVIALALWPVVLFVLRFLHERRKKLECIERMTKDELDDIATKDLVISVLKKIGCQPKENEEGNIAFKYQGDDFYIAAEDENRFIMIWNPWWGTISADNEALPYLKEIINIVNINSLITTVTMVDEDDSNSIGIHSRCHTYFTPNEGELEEHLKMLLDMFFDTHNAIKENLNQLGAAANAEVEKGRVKVKGFAAYKENTTEIETEKKEEATPQ